MNKLTPVITTTEQNHPERKDEIDELIKKFNEAKNDRPHEALQFLTELGKLLKSLKEGDEAKKKIDPILQSLSAPMTVDAKFAEKFLTAGLDPLKLSELWGDAVNAINTLAI
jgi:hypothetical protein